MNDRYMDNQNADEIKQMLDQMADQLRGFKTLSDDEWQDLMASARNLTNSIEFARYPSPLDA